MCRSEHLSIFAELAAPFAADEVRTRNLQGRDIQYVTARTVMNRLDEVLGPENWSDAYQPLGDGDVMCLLSITLPGGRVVTKSDVGGSVAMRDDSDSEKTGFSDAFKRAAVKFGIARYLYGDGVPWSIRERLVAKRRAEREAQQGPAALPAPEVPAIAGGGPEAAAPPSGPRRRDDADDGRRAAPSPTPKTGKALFAWIKERDEKDGLELLRTLTDWGRDLGYPARMVQWSGEQVDRGHVEALRLLTGMRSAGGGGRSG